MPHVATGTGHDITVLEFPDGCNDYYLTPEGIPKVVGKMQDLQNFVNSIEECHTRNWWFTEGRDMDREIWCADLLFNCISQTVSLQV